MKIHEILDAVKLFNIMPYDSDIYKIAADWYEEQGFLVPSAIKNKILPIEINRNGGLGCGNTINGKGNGAGSAIVFGNYCICYGLGNGYGYGYGNGYSRGIGSGYGAGNGYGNGVGFSNDI